MGRKVIVIKIELDDTGVDIQELHNAAREIWDIARKVSVRRITRWK